MSGGGKGKSLPMAKAEGEFLLSHMHLDGHPSVVSAFIIPLQWKEKDPVRRERVLAKKDTALLPLILGLL